MAVTNSLTTKTNGGTFFSVFISERIMSAGRLTQS